MKQENFSPLSLIAIFAGIVEASALASLPFLSEASQGIYTWFLVGFPFFLTVLFFLTLNFNAKALFSPQSSSVAPAPSGQADPLSPALARATTREPNASLIALSGPQSGVALEQHILRIVRQPQNQAQRWVFYDLEGQRCLEICRTPLEDDAPRPPSAPEA
ncbi:MULTISPECIES: hypothetical protein [Pseudomonas]|jgi:hypothetical protein|uniref:Uncharacterized protein n=1 Tax=Pseudomonas mosselii TaxID=78327 RepID=A0A5R8YQW0_9PSED|nr:hypothetical protein [Pseudomonas mosselii]TLP55851.1 hypothetical protein FEM01_19610 [Pseudomonas mosselii]